jgi:hypothetical protein
LASLKQNAIRTGLEALYFSGAHKLMRPFVGGMGTILTLHHVRPARPDRFQPNRLLEYASVSGKNLPQAAPFPPRHRGAGRDAPPPDGG